MTGWSDMKLTGTNQMYIFSITNYFGVELWNSYSNAYPNAQIVVQDSLLVTVTNGATTSGTQAAQLIASASYNLQPYPIQSVYIVGTWPGWTNNNASSFVLPLGTSGVVTFSVLPTSIYSSQFGTFTPITAGSDFENYLPVALAQIGMVMSNWLQVFMLNTDAYGNVHVIDYAQFSGPNSSRNLNSELADPNSTELPAYLWSTNLFGAVPFGVINQINVSSGVAPLPTPIDGGSWISPPGLPPQLNGNLSAM
jgi:hypothetical protein